MPASAPDERHRYLLRNAPFASPFDRAFAWHVPEPLRLAEMAEAAAYYGDARLCRVPQCRERRDHHRSNGLPVGDAGRFRRTASARYWECWGPRAYEVEGDGFLRHMVRAIIGTLVDVVVAPAPSPASQHCWRAGQGAGRPAPRPRHTVFTSLGWTMISRPAEGTKDARSSRLAGRAPRRPSRQLYSRRSPKDLRRVA